MHSHSDPEAAAHPSSQIHAGFAVHQPSRTNRCSILASALEQYDISTRIGACTSSGCRDIR